VAEPRDTDPKNLKNAGASPRTHPGDDRFAAPLGSLTSGRLRFTSGAHRVVIRANLHLQDLYRARFGNRPPVVGVRGGVVTIGYPRNPACDWLNLRSELPAEIELNPRIRWDVEVRGGASRLVADLRELRLGSLSLDGGASRIEVVLPAPSGTVAVVILGGASNVAVHRPNGVAARLRVGGGATNLQFDERHIGATGGELDLRDRDYDRAADRYDIAVTGGANNLSIGKQQDR